MFLTWRKNPSASSSEPISNSKNILTGSGSGFDPTGLERAAKAAREIDASAHGTLAFDVFRHREVTKQLEYGTQQAAYEMQARHYEMGRVREEGTEARHTLQVQTEHANQQAQYVDGLDRQRYATQLGVRYSTHEAELQRLEESIRSQENMRRSTLRYEAELRSKTELKRAEAEAKARADSDRKNHDLSLDLMRAEMQEQRETLLQSISYGFSSIGDGTRAFLGDRQQMSSAVGLASILALGIYGARAVATVAGSYLATQLGKPTLVRETSLVSFMAPLLRPFNPSKKFAGSVAEMDALDRLVLQDGVKNRLRHIASSVKYTNMHGAPFRHVLLHGPPGTGKTMFAKQLAMRSGLDYAILTGGDIAPLGRDAVTEIHKLFDWATRSSDGLLLFIDEADAFLRNRTTDNMSEDLRNAFNAFLYRTGESSRDFMLVYASNAPEEFDWAVNDRIDEMVEFALPTEMERRRMLVQYLDDHQVSSGTIRDNVLIESAVAKTKGFSGREIHKLVLAWQAAAMRSLDGQHASTIMREVLNAHVVQSRLKASWRNT